MKLADAHLFARYASARAALMHQRDHARIGVTLDGTYQDGAMIEAVRPIVTAELDQRIAVIEAELVVRGVHLDIGPD